ncbi:hypothetical protein [Sphingobacterium siyangense]|uniref:Uncharacterized protein n=1 Tax=Sphingobacterium siyangense TaxID=459529 RepID=A0A562MQX9_9SPHI|nr:hypothetical protein [Sphingobacterium siyangense]TWI22198.1 hypothetical protein IQ31_01603 [Sphingobacterium siyangense]
MAFNSREYEWADITVIAGGRDLLGIRGVKYTRKIEREAVYAKGRKAKAIQSGNESVEGELVLLQSTYNELLDSSGGDILSLSIDTEVTYGNPSRGDALRTDRLIGIRFTEEAVEFKQGDKFAEITVPFLALDIQKNV